MHEGRLVEAGGHGRDLHRRREVHGPQQIGGRTRGPGRAVAVHKAVPARAHTGGVQGGGGGTPQGPRPGAVAPGHRVRASLSPEGQQCAGGLERARSVVWVYALRHCAPSPNPCVDLDGYWGGMTWIM